MFDSSFQHLDKILYLVEVFRPLDKILYLVEVFRPLDKILCLVEIFRPLDKILCLVEVFQPLDKILCLVYNIHVVHTKLVPSGFRFLCYYYKILYISQILYYFIRTFIKRNYT